jgi:2-methylcitrate dehydratase PrpD
MTGSVMQEIADYAVAEQTAVLSDAVRHAAKRAIIDFFSVVLPGGTTPPATLLIQALDEQVGHGRAVLYPSAKRAPAPVAALINGTAAHSIEFDDIFRDATYHPGCPVIAAALALGQSRQVDGERFLRAVIVGYEVSTRIGAAMMPAHFKYWHSTGTVGCFGAAAAAATILGLDRAKFSHAMGTAGTFASGLQQAFRSASMTKPLHAGHAAETGAMAALAAAQGVTGVPDILEGEVGFGAAMSHDVDWATATRGLGRSYNIMRMTVKNHGCCGHSFAAIDGAQELQRRHGLAPEAIAAIRVGTYGLALKIAGSYTHATPFEGQFSLPYVVASALVHGTVRLDAFTQERLTCPRTQALIDKISVAVDPRFNATFPNQRAAAIEIDTVDGRTLRHEQTTRRGDPDSPLSDDELVGKFHELAGVAIGDGSRALIDALWSIDARPNLDLPLGAGIAAAEGASAFGGRDAAE